MTDFPSYAFGTVSVDAGGTVVTGTDTLWSGVNARSGDVITIAGHTVIVVDVTDETHLVIDAWPFDAVTDGTYKITQRSPLRFVGAEARADVTRLLSTLEAKGLVWTLDAAYASPNDLKPIPTANEGQLFYQSSTGKFWAMTSGAWTSIASPYGLQAGNALSEIAALGKQAEALANLGGEPMIAPTYDDLAALGAATVPASVAFVRTASHSLAGKLGAAIYRKVDVEPTHPLKEQSADGAWWDLSAPRVDATMAGMVGDNNYDNGQALADAMGYAGMFGAEVFLPRGRYKVAATTQMISPAAPPSIIGEGGNASIIEAAVGEYYALEFKDCDGMHLQGFRVRKPVGAEDYDGGAIYIHETPYMYLHDVAVWGFAVGVELVNVVSGEFSRLLALYNDIGVRASVNTGATGLVTRPNALTFVSPSWGGNKSWGGYFTEPALLKIVGGSIEGNGQGVASNHGGLYIFNAGTEGGVGLNLTDVQMERNKGDADVYIVGLANAGTVYNIENCAIFPIDATNYTANRIHFENSVQQNLNLRGNSFKHFGGYTPDAGRKVISAASAALVCVNVCGDIRQFYSDTEFPTGFGAMGMSYAGTMNADGSALNMPAGWNCSKITEGHYQVTPPAYIAPSDFAWNVTSLDGDPAAGGGASVGASAVDFVMAAATDRAIGFSATGIK